MTITQHYKKGTYIAIGILILVIIAWFALVSRGDQSSYLAHPAGGECFFDTRTGDACSYAFPCLTLEQCEKVEDAYTTTLATLEAYVLSDSYRAPEETIQPNVVPVIISVRDVAKSPWQSLFHILATSQLATASRSLISDEDTTIVAKPYTLPEDATVWDLAQLIIPPEYLQKVVEYREESDGPRHMLAYVEPLDSNGAQWALVVDPADAYSVGGFNDPQKLITTLVHEFGHALSLNNEQINHGSSRCDAPAYEALEGCTLPGAYLETFVNQFWLDILPEFLQLSDGQKLGFYGRYSDRFVNSYAASDPGEDFAESFAYFVVTKGRGTDTIAQKKLEYFYADAEFVHIRDYMRRQMVIAMDALQK